MLIGFFPFILLLSYTLYLSNTKMVQSLILEHSERVDGISKGIHEHIELLMKEAAFLSTLDVMDDLLVEDIDNRISRLFTQKAFDLGYGITIMALDLNGVVIASSGMNIDQDQNALLAKMQGISGLYQTDTHLYVFTKIYSSFNATQPIGAVLIEYELKNLDSFLLKNKTLHSYLFNPLDKRSIGETINFTIDRSSEKGNAIDEHHVIIYKRLQEPLREFYLVYAIDKEIAFEIIDDFMRFMIYVSAAILLLIVYVAVWFSKSIVEPIKELRDRVATTIELQDYSTLLELSSQDEIAALGEAYNTLMQTIAEMIQRLQDESRYRLERFIELVELFNAIIQTTSENECIDSAIERMNTLKGTSRISFVKELEKGMQSEAIALYINDFDTKSKGLYGYLVFSEEPQEYQEREFFHSIATMITLQLERISLIEKTLQASNAKSAFISSMSHELRTPLHAIIGATQHMIGYERMRDEQFDSVASIEASAHYLLGMINEILDIAKIEAGRMDVHMQMCDIGAILQELYEMLYALAEDKGLDFSLDLSGLTLQKLESDPKIFKQIVINLISNAIKFTQEGSVRIKIIEDGSTVSIVIEDSGIGIDADEIERLFNDFTQLDNAVHTSQRGTGLGLSLSKKMAHLLHGDVVLQSRGRAYGTSAYFSLNLGLLKFS